MSRLFQAVYSRVVPWVIEGEQGEKKDRERNDRIVAIEEDAHSWADIKTLDDLGEEFCRELEVCELP